MDRPNDVGIPALEATHGQAPQGPKVDHFMTSGIRIGKRARETLIAGAEFVNRITSRNEPPKQRPRMGAVEFKSRL